MLDMMLIQLIVAVSMSLGALCLLFWAIAGGQFEDVEEVKYRVYWTEVNDDDEAETKPRHRQTEPPRGGRADP